MRSDFKTFLEKANVVGLALAVIVGGAAGALVKAMTDDFLMPILSVFLPEGDWRTYTVTVGQVELGVGDFAGVFLNFLIITYVAFQIGKVFMKEEQKALPPPTKRCPFCDTSIPEAATRCPNCTSELK